jgi:hypothetical protein
MAVISIIPFVGDAVFEPSDIRLMSDAFRSAIEDVYRFGHPNKIVERIMAIRIIALTHGDERDPKRLHERALAACGFKSAIDQRPPTEASSLLVENRSER